MPNLLKHFTHRTTLAFASWLACFACAPLALAQSGGGGPAPDDGDGTTLLGMLHAGGIVGYLILALSLVALSLVVMHALQVRRNAFAPPELVEALRGTLAQDDRSRAIAQAQELCEEPEYACFLTAVMGAGLRRYARSAFGALELKGALEEAGQAQVARLYRSTDGLALIAAVAPMLGLLGTVVGINGAFATISTTDGFQRPDALAGDISLALTTTIMGLVLAIPATAALTFFRNRIDGAAAEVAADIDELADMIEAPAAESSPNAM